MERVRKYLFGTQDRTLSFISLVGGVIGIFVTVASWKFSELQSSLYEIGQIIAVILSAVAGLLSAWSGLRGLVSPFKMVKKTKEMYPKLSIIGIIREKRLYQIRGALIIFLILIVLYLIASLVYLIDYFVVIVPGILISLLVIGQVIFDYRVRNGFYGKNEREAREIIQFIIQESSNIDFTDDGKLKSIISEEDLKKIEQVATNVIPGVVG